MMQKPVQNSTQNTVWRRVLERLLLIAGAGTALVLVKKKKDTKETK